MDCPHLKCSLESTASSAVLALWLAFIGVARGQPLADFGGEALTLLRDRRYDTGDKRRSSVLRVLDETLTHLFESAPLFGSGPAGLYRRVDWETRGLLATPEPLTDAGLAEALQAASDNPAVLEDLGEPEQIARHWIMNAEQLREFAGQGQVVRDNDAFFLPINAEMETLIQIIQLAAVRANP